MKNEFRKQLNSVVPPIPDVFDAAMKQTFAHIAAHETAQASSAANRTNFGSFRRRTLVYILVALLLVTAVAVAATLLTQNVFQITIGTTPENGEAITQYNLATATFEKCDVTIEEAAYDGVSLYIVYSIRDRDVTEPLGQFDEESGLYLLSEEVTPGMLHDQIGWWTDNIWIDGSSTSMPNMSGMQTIGSENPGELLFYMMFRLDQENIFLDGKNVEIALPIGKQQARESLVIDEESGSIQKPADGLVSFRLDCSLREGVTEAHPNEEVKLEHLTANVSSVIYTPIQMYVTIGMQINPDAFDTYIAENGDGYYDESGQLLWKYDGLELMEGWAMNLTLADATGKPVFDTMEGFYGCHGASVSEAWYTFPYMQNYPEQMYLAPYGDDGLSLDMGQAVRVR